MASGPDSSITDRIRSATMPMASSHEAWRNSPEPFGPERTSGVMIRSGAYTRLA